VPLTRAFKAELPLAQLAFTEGFSVPMFEGLRLGNLDMALLYNPASSADLEQTLLHEESLVLISASQADIGLQSAISLKATSRLPLILPSRPNAFRQLLDHEMTRLGVKPKIVMEVDGLNAILSLVQEGLGHAVLPSYTLAPYPKDSFVVRAITQPKLISQLMLVRPSQRPTTLTQQKAKSLLHTVVVQMLT
jgi:LysR family nitrogen assimilation transcriptional regulator